MSQTQVFGLTSNENESWAGSCSSIRLQELSSHAKDEQNLQASEGGAQPTMACLRAKADGTCVDCSVQRQPSPGRQDLPTIRFAGHATGPCRWQQVEILHPSFGRHPIPPALCRPSSALCTLTFRIGIAHLDICAMASSTAGRALHQQSSSASECSAFRCVMQMLTDTSNVPDKLGLVFFKQALLVDSCLVWGRPAEV